MSKVKVKSEVVEREVRQVVKERVYRPELTERQALVILALLRKVGGSPVTTYRKECDEISAGLKEALDVPYNRLRNFMPDGGGLYYNFPAK